MKLVGDLFFKGEKYHHGKIEAAENYKMGAEKGFIQQTLKYVQVLLTGDWIEKDEEKKNYFFISKNVELQQRIK